MAQDKSSSAVAIVAILVIVVICAAILYYVGVFGPVTTTNIVTTPAAPVGAQAPSNTNAPAGPTHAPAGHATQTSP